MGILQSVMPYLGIEADNEENMSQSNNGKATTRSHQMKYLTLTVPDLRGSSSLARTRVDDNVRNSVSLVKENVPPNVCSGGEGRWRDGTPVMVKCIAAVPESRWIKHYSSNHRILLVGEGDVSFSTCLASAFGWGSNMVATSLNSRDTGVKYEDYEVQ